MILVTHGIIGAAIGRLFPGAPVVAFLAGVASHFIADSIPHWHYPLLSEKRDPHNPMNADMVIGRKFLIDLVDMGIDASAGIVFSILAFQGWAGFSDPSISLLAGALGGILPDTSHFLYMKIRREPFHTVQRFHVWIHSKVNIDRRHFTGIGSQILICLAAVLLSRALF